MFSFYPQVHFFNTLSLVIINSMGKLKQKQNIIFNFMNKNRFNKNLIFFKSLSKNTRLVHKFHLVDRSYWPFFISTVAFMLTTSCVVFFFFGDLFNLTMSFIFLILISILWWRDVIRESLYEGKHTSQVQFGIKLGVVLFIITEVMFFSSFWDSFVLYADSNGPNNSSDYERISEIFLKKNPHDFLIYLSDDKEKPDYFRSLYEGCKRDNSILDLHRRIYNGINYFRSLDEQLEYGANYIKTHGMSVETGYKIRIFNLENPLARYRPEFVRFLDPESYIKSNLNLSERVLFSQYCEDLMHLDEKARFQMDIEEKLNYKLYHYSNRHKNMFDQYVYIDDLAAKKFTKSGNHREFMDEIKKENYLSSCKNPIEKEVYKRLFELLKSGSFDFFVFENFKDGYKPEDKSIVALEAFDFDSFLNKERLKGATADHIGFILNDYLNEFYDFKKIFFKRIYDPFKECYDNIVLNSSKDEHETPCLDKLYRKLSKDWAYFNEKKAELPHYYNLIIDTEGPFMEVINKEIENPVLTVEELFSDRFSNSTVLWNYWMDQRGYKYVTFNTELGTILLKNKYGIEFHLEIPTHLYDKILQDFEYKKKLGQLFNPLEDSILNNFEIEDSILPNYTIDDFMDIDHLNIYEKLILEIINKESVTGLYRRIIPFYDSSLDDRNNPNNIFRIYDSPFDKIVNEKYNNLEEIKLDNIKKKDNNLEEIKLDNVNRKDIINLELKNPKLYDVNKKNIINLELKDPKLYNVNKKDIINLELKDPKLYNSKHEEQLLAFIKGTAPHIFEDLEDFKKFDELHGNFFFGSNVEDLNLEDSKNEDLSTNIRFSSNFQDRLLENLKFEQSSSSMNSNVEDSDIEDSNVDHFNK